MNQFFKAVSLASCLSLGLLGMVNAQEPTLDVVTDPSFVPFEMLDQASGEMVGFDIDIINEVAERSGFEINLRTMDFNGIIPAIQTGNVDIAIAGTTITDERAKIVDFSDPYYDSGLRLLVAADDDSITKVEDLEGKKVATKIGSTSFDYLTEKLGDKTKIVPFPGTSDMYLALMGGNVDAVFYDAPNVAYFAKTQGQGRVQTVGDLYEGQQYGIVFVKGSEWVEPANEALAAMKEDGSYDEIHAKWFGEVSEEAAE